ncbi:MAG: DUF418 domain-containing protein [Bacteroidales bacterium]|nr:DUF418 domain-containing protein [Bacteroidales bacterium]MCR5828559.1 DUF418 domain-containing protein [Bacteroidales bacterium]
MYKTKGLRNSRIEVADALRGIAVVGIILYHSVEHFNLGSAHPSLSLPCDGFVFNLLTVLLSGKMYGIFALLFGLSFFIMRDNQEQKGRDFSLRFAWRMVLLFCFGVINMTFYNGDILTFYALLGLLMIPAGYLSTPVLWAVTIFLLVQPIEIYSLLSGWKPDISAMGKYYMTMGRAAIDGNFFECAGASLRYGFLTSLLWFIGKGRMTQTLGLFFLGILFGRLRLFYDEGNHRKVWRIVLTVSAAAVIAGSILGHWARGSISFGEGDALLHPLYNLAILMLIVSGVVLLWYRFDGFRKSLSHICFFGRMSLTNYLLSSVLGCFIFYGWGLALNNVLGTTWSFLTGIGIVVFQILLLRLWARKHKRGPLETIWRKLTWIGSDEASK